MPLELSRFAGLIFKKMFPERLDPYLEYGMLYY